MRAAFSETAKNDPNCEIRLGVASWDTGNGTAQAVKYTRGLGRILSKQEFSHAEV
jgi:hypothetical protein